MSAYKNAIDLTMETIGSRAKSYRNLVVAVVLTGICSIVWTVAAWTISPLSGLILLFPLCSLYFLMDSRILSRWRSRLLADWVKGNIEFRYFQDAVNANPVLPKETLQGMLDTLPAVSDQGISLATREAIAGFATFIHTCRTDVMALRTVGYALAGGSLIIAVILRTWHPLLGIITLVLIPLGQQCVKTWRRGKSREVIANAQEKADFNNEKYLEIVSQLHQDPIPNSELIDIMGARTEEAK